MKTKLLLVRHGSARSGEARVVGGHMGCHGLSPKGTLQIRHLGEELVRRRIVPELLYVSSIRRARQSATILSDILGTPVISPECLWCELHPGSLDAVPFRRLPPPRATFDEDVPMASGAESAVDLRARAALALRVIERVHRGQFVGVVSHQGFLGDLAQCAMGHESAMFPSWTMSEGSSLVLGRSRGGWRPISR